MAVYELTLPLRDADIEQLNIGDAVYLTGTVCTARDMGHLNMRELVDNGRPLPENLQGGAIFHAGPVMVKRRRRQLATARYRPNDVDPHGATR